MLGCFSLEIGNAPKHLFCSVHVSDCTADVEHDMIISHKGVLSHIGNLPFLDKPWFGS